MTEVKYSSHTYNLAHSRIDEPIHIKGSSINVIGINGDCFIKINNKWEDPINLLHASIIKTNFTKFFLSNKTQLNCFASFIVGKQEFELTTNIKQSSHQALLIPQQHIPNHLKNRVIEKP